MALAALIAACREADDGGEGLAATLPLAGRTLLEHQARLAARAGATHIVILVERLPGPLTAAIDRLRGDGLAVEVARSVTDAADRLHPDERLLVFAEGLFADQRLVDRLAEASSPTLLVSADGPETRMWERIDAASRWAGLALVDGARLRRTAAMLGEWDLIATLVRQAVSDSARRLDVADGADVGAPPLHALIGSEAEAGELGERLLVESRRQQRRSWPARWLFVHLEEPAVALLMARPIEANWLRAGAVALAGLGATAFAFGWLWAGLVLLLLSGPLDAVGERLGAVRLQSVRYDNRLMRGRTIAAAAALLALGARLTLDRIGDEPILLALVTLAWQIALIGERRLLSRAAPGIAAPAWLAVTDAAIWAYLPFAVLGCWRIGLGALALYAAVSFFRVQHLAVAATSRRHA